ncbi:polysaccharide deacetylase family protein [Anabaena subtropica]|uniref:Polysaccharide deacetylase family protein n=1 Tax=Anabaena subtropica FACHB-260 TaxID=2692884 RepID=A0ABR8CTN7_9NOST|nr:polysaccharide deacetylase family protein [Anabaena subtropica]MBD2346339.1 polysaccharide deacetylase family protein [Anabaena subtropica FACHB-260]
MTAKTQNFPFGLALVSIIFLAALNFGHSETTVPILGFHGIIDPQNNNIKSVAIPEEMHYSKQELEKLLNDLIINDYWFLSTQDLYNFYLTKSQEIPANYRRKKPIMLTFDDGYKSVHTKLLPILSKLEKQYGQKVKIVLFINPSRLEQKASSSKTHLSCEEIREGLQKDFYDIQSHGLNHRDLTNLSRREIVRELLHARTILRRCTEDLDPKQQVGSHFAYPYGAYNKQVESYVSRYYLSGYLYNNETFDYTCQQNPYQIPRLIVNYNKSSQQIIKMAKDIALINNQACQQEEKGQGVRQRGLGGFPHERLRTRRAG